MCRPAGRALVGGRSAATAGGRPDSTSAGVERHGASHYVGRHPPPTTRRSMFMVDYPVPRHGAF